MAERRPVRVGAGDALAALLARDIAPMAPALPQQARMRSRILDACTPPMMVSRADEGHWQPLLPGVLVRCLNINEKEGTQLTLWRMSAGARIPAHRHTLAEECLVVEGLITHAGIEYSAGDFLLSAAGSAHDVFESPAGAVLMIRGELVPKRIALAAKATETP